MYEKYCENRVAACLALLGTSNPSFANVSAALWFSWEQFVYDWFIFFFDCVLFLILYKTFLAVLFEVDRLLFYNYFTQYGSTRVSFVSQPWNGFVCLNGFFRVCTCLLCKWSSLETVALMKKTMSLLLTTKYSHLCIIEIIACKKARH